MIDASDSAYLPGNGLRLYAHRFRDPDAAPSGLTVLFLHGFLDAGATWDLVAPRLAAAGHEVVAPDLRGYGRSDRVGPGGYYHFADYVADVAAVVDALAPARLAVVGHSMGGTVASLYAGTAGARVERLALLEGLGALATEPRFAVDRMQSWLRDLRRVQREPRPLESVDDAANRLAATHPAVPRDVIATRAALLVRELPDGRVAWAYDPLHRTTSPIPFQVESFKAFLAAIACPVLYVSGGPTGWQPPDEADRLASVRDLRRVELAGAGHMMHWSAPEPLAEALVTFLAEPAPGP